ncbi:Mannosyl phosphorylinositol ceramide synthase SUR1 [Colletotrichum sidae]|uniref:Mannosyl phosphorylinositol ceramide synthase SUR1 n=1 Tax=Colletotrichum sidae TaxID=1347389 RepID=A0A4V3I476_9PEZI|nr:Mannosyl phosphorylinositol ceramide synthase SUR1 [Colletotrichum sidae]
MLRALSAVRHGRTRPILAFVGLVSILLVWSCRGLLQTTWTLVSLPLSWSRGADRFLISQEADGFDVTFGNYSRMQDAAGPGYEDKIPPVLHHIMLNAPAARAQWQEARQSCLDVHPGWEVHFWTDAEAGQFVADKYPELKDMWDNYRYPIQKIDALRYLVLYEYGGAVLDMDLRCRRSLGPLRRFDFVAPAAHPVGFSNGFMMASKGNWFIKQAIDSLRTYNRHWFGLSYPTIMFSTGCHYVSTIHSLQKNRTTLKILTGTKENPNLHRLNGAVTTPLFDHLGSSSWHSFDAAFILFLGRLKPIHIILGISGVVCIVLLTRRVLVRRANGPWMQDVEGGVRKSAA